MAARKRPATEQPLATGAKNEERLAKTFGRIWMKFWHSIELRAATRPVKAGAQTGPTRDQVKAWPAERSLAVLELTLQKRRKLLGKAYARQEPDPEAARHCPRL
ncbi:Hypothetical predicted protein [Pelobates cultripes]|uniref:Uncharacterized protein n=1 Tax=Pelobates cultripes TaxID=61616 RepID=A0AAD1TD96_PELCU|nr:Hypothetical predicted protein [Pelobates cultripes]